MNPAWQAGLTVGATALVQLLIGMYVYGQLTQQVKDQGGWLKRHENELSKHSEQLLDHEGRIAHIEGRKGLPYGGE